MTLVEIEAPQRVRMIRKQYAIVPLGGTKLEGWPRATTVAKTFDDSFGLEGHWKGHTLVGAHMDPSLAALAAEAHDAGDKRARNRHAEKAFELAGGNVKRDRGTIVHDYVERKVANPEWDVPALYRAQVEAIVAGIAAKGFRVVVEFSERILVHDRHKIAGKCDFILYHEATDTYYVGDLKTGSVGFPLPWAIQLAIYANADAAYNQGAADDGSEDTRDPLPPLNRERAVIINSPLDTTDVDFYWLDIATGAELLDLAIKVRKTGTLKSKVLVKFEGGGTTSTAGTAEVVGSVEDNQPNAAAPVTSADSGSPSVCPDSGAVSAAILHETRTAWLINKATHLVDTLSKEHVAQVWPTDVPRPLAIKDGEAVWTDDDIDAVARALDALEAKHDVPFGHEDPAVTAARRAALDAKVAEEVERTKVTPAPEPEPDGAPFAPAGAVKNLLAIVQSMSADKHDLATIARLSRVQHWQTQGTNKRVPWKIGNLAHDKVPERLYAIVAAAVGCLDLIDLNAADPDAAVRDLLGAVLDDHDLAQQPSHPVGALFGLLTTDQALRLADMAEGAS